MPTVNSEIERLVRLLDWAEASVTEPLATDALPTGQIETCVKTPLVVSGTWGRYDKGQKIV